MNDESRQGESQSERGSPEGKDSLSHINKFYMDIDLKKINFRPHQRKDIKYRVQWLNNKLINKFLFEDSAKTTTIEKQQNWFDDYEKTSSKKFFTILYNDTPIGFIGLSKIDKHNSSTNLFIMIGEKTFQGKGIGSLTSKFILDYAFNKLNLNKVTLEVNKNNIAAIKLYESLGFIEDKNLSNKKEVAMFFNKV